MGEPGGQTSLGTTDLGPKATPTPKLWFSLPSEAITLCPDRNLPQKLLPTDTPEAVPPARVALEPGYEDPTGVDGACPGPSLGVNVGKG